MNNQHAEYDPVFYRESDGMRFERCYHPGYVRCEVCLELVRPEVAMTHQCVEWWDITPEEYERYLRGVFSNSM